MYIIHIINNVSHVYDVQYPSEFTREKAGPLPKTENYNTKL